MYLSSIKCYGAFVGMFHEISIARALNNIGSRTRGNEDVDKRGKKTI